MKKCWIIIVFILFFILSLPARAEKILVQVADDFPDKYPPFEYSFVLSDGISLDKGGLIEKGSLIKGRIFEVVEPKRLNRDAYLIFIADSYTIPSDNQKTIKIKNRISSKIRCYKKFQIPEKKELMKTAIGLIVPGLDYGISFAEGVAKPDENTNRFKTGCHHVLESWPFSYCLKGDELKLEPGASAIFDFDKKMFEQ